MCKIPRQRRDVFLPGEAESIVDLAAALIVRYPIAVPGLLSSMQLAARLSDRGITTEHVTRAVDEWLARAIRIGETMNAAQHAFVREQFTKWVESTDVAEQCGLTRKEMLDSVEFNTHSDGDAVKYVGAAKQDLQAAMVKFLKERKRRLFIDGEVITMNGRFVDPDRVDE